MLTSKDFTKNYAHFLTKVVRAANRYDIPDYDALLKKMAGTRSNRDIVKKLFYWIPRSKRADGVIYKSSVELAYETGVSKGTVDRAAHIIEGMGFDRQIKRANGSPTAHYALNMHRFLEAIAHVLGVNWVDVDEWMTTTNSTDTKCVNQDTNPQNVSNVEEVKTGQEGDETQNWEMLFDDLLNSNLDEWLKAKIENHKVQFLKMRQSITDNTTHQITNTKGQTVNNTQPPIAPPRPTAGTPQPVSLLREVERIRLVLQTTPANVKTWVRQHGIERVRAVVAAAERDTKIQNKGAWVRRALEHNYTLQSSEPTYDVSEYLKALNTGMRMP